MESINYRDQGVEIGCPSLLSFYRHLGSQPTEALLEIDACAIIAILGTVFDLLSIWELLLFPVLFYLSCVLVLGVLIPCFSLYSYAAVVFGIERSGTPLV